MSEQSLNGTLAYNRLFSGIQFNEGKSRIN